MQSLGINKQLMYYAMFSAYTDITKDGMKTGDKSKTYHQAVSMWANISPSTGTAEMEPFGTDVDYDRIIVTSDMTCPINENSILWIGRDTTEKHNFIVRRVAKSLNSIRYAVKEVTKS